MVKISHLPVCRETVGQKSSWKLSDNVTDEESTVQEADHLRVPGNIRQLSVNSNPILFLNQTCYNRYILFFKRLGIRHINKEIKILVYRYVCGISTDFV